MYLRTGLLSLAALLLLGAAPTNQQIENDKEKMAGTYKVNSLEVNGKIREIDPNMTFEVIVTRKTITIKVGAQERESTYRIDPTKDPKTIDLVWKDKVTLGIYSVDEKRLKLCLASEGSRKRPNEFETKPGSGWTYFNLRPVKR